MKQRRVTMGNSGLMPFSECPPTPLTVQGASFFSSLPSVFAGQVAISNPSRRSPDAAGRQCPPSAGTAAGSRTSPRKRCGGLWDLRGETVAVSGSSVGEVSSAFLGVSIWCLSCIPSSRDRGTQLFDRLFEGLIVGVSAFDTRLYVQQPWRTWGSGPV